MSEAFVRGLARAAAARYPARDRFARGFAYGKIVRDPVFRYILEHGLIAPGARVLDLGSGQGLLEALLLASREAASAGWPAGWAPAPLGARLRGIEISARDVERARLAAGGGEAHFVHGDIRVATFGEADVCVLLDVLHYLDDDDQERVLDRARGALAAGGRLIVRVADSARGLRFGLTLAADRLAMALRGRWFAHHCKPLERWIAQIAAAGFRVEAIPMSGGTPFANVLLVARYDR